MKFVSAEFNRGAGLGNKLFPWARAAVFSRRHGYAMLRTRWFSPHGGGITRGGIDYAKALRKIWLVGNFKRMPDELPRWRSFFCNRSSIVKCASISEAEVLKNKAHHIIFTWNGNHNFCDFKGEEKFLREKFLAMVSNTQKRFAAEATVRFPNFIGLNVRCGKDFVTKESGIKGYVKTDIDWFIHGLKTIRNQYGELPAVVVSDGGRKELYSLLKERNVFLLDSPSAAADLLVLSQAKVLLGSGNSTFSAWASFLGEMDTFSSHDTPFTYAGLEDGRFGRKIVGVI